MPSLPSPTPFSLFGNLVVRSAREVMAFLPSLYRRLKEAPVRDLLIGALAAIAREWQRRSSYAIDQSAIPTATDQYLDGLVSDYDLARASGESNEALRRRALAVPEQVSPKALLAAINAIMAPHTSIPVRMLEPGLDGWFVHDGDAVWNAFLEAPPEYPDRLYAPGPGEGTRRDQSEPHGAIPHPEPIGRELLLLIPSFAPEGAATFVSDSSSVWEDVQFFVGEAPFPFGFVWTGGAITKDVYASLANSLDRILGQSIRITFLETMELG